jgi:hypothetical protein
MKTESPTDPILSCKLFFKTLSALAGFIKDLHQAHDVIKKYLRLKTFLKFQSNHSWKLYQSRTTKDVSKVI